MNRYPTSFANRLIWRFQKSGGEGQYTKLFTNLDQEAQISLLTQANLSKDEVPAVAFYFNSSNWVLLTSKRLVYSQNSAQNSTDLTEIEDATVESSGLLHTRLQGKMGLRQLTIVTKNGKAQLDLEPGFPFSGFWNTLKMVASKNKPIS